MPKRKETCSFVDEWKSMWEPDLEAIAFNGATCDPTRVDPKVLHWAKRNCSHTPHFIKIVNNNAAHGRPRCKSRKNNCQLTVPWPFVKEHFRKLGRVVTLENDEGKKWRVSFGAARTNPSWLQGWRQVAADNDLKPGEVIVFVLVASSHFRFTRFDEDGNIISTNPKLNDIITCAPTDDHSTAAAADLRLVDRHGLGAPSQPVAPADKQIAEAPFTRRRLRKVGEIKSKAEAGSTSSPDSLISSPEWPHFIHM